MNPTIDLLAGAAQALLFSLFAIAAAGKLAGCRRGAGVMCRKGLFDLLLAGGLGLAWPVPVGAGFACVAILIGAGGWLGERVRATTACNCFGLLTAPLHPWRNHARAAMVAGGAVLLAGTLAGRDVGTLAHWQGSSAVLALLLATLSYATARRLQAAAARAVAPQAAAMPAALLDRSTYLGRDSDGLAVRLGELAQGARPIALVLSSRDCGPCGELKRELLPLLGNFPFPVRFVVENAAGVDSEGPLFVHDPDASFRHLIAGKSLPSLVLIDPTDWTFMGTPAGGSDKIHRALLRLVLSGESPASDIASGAGAARIPA